MGRDRANNYLITLLRTIAKIWDTLACVASVSVGFSVLEILDVWVMGQLSLEKLQRTISGFRQ